LSVTCLLPATIPFPGGEAYPVSIIVSSALPKIRPRKSHCSHEQHRPKGCHPGPRMSPLWTSRGPERVTYVRAVSVAPATGLNQTSRCVNPQGSRPPNQRLDRPNMQPSAVIFGEEIRLLCIVDKLPCKLNLRLQPSSTSQSIQSVKQFTQVVQDPCFPWSWPISFPRPIPVESGGV
jgi:hypothetical protein